MISNVDVFGNSLDLLNNKKLFLFDMDGTIYKDNNLFDGVIELLNLIKNNNGNYVFITNNSSKSVQDYINKLRKLGIDVDYDNFLTSTQATILYLKQNYKDDLIYGMGTNSFINELKDSNINVTEELCENIKLVLISYDIELNYKKLMNACYLLTNDIDYVATNPDLVCPTSFGFVPDCGSIAQMIYTSTKKMPKFIGKPEPTMIELAIEKFGVSKDETVVIGDRLYTDIASGINADVLSVCVLTGEATIDSIINEEIKPDLTLNSIKDIFQYLNKL